MKPLKIKYLTLLGMAAFAFCASSASAASAPQRVVSLNVCTDEYIFRLLPPDRIAALSYLAADHHPIVSTIADDVARTNIHLIRQSAEEVLAAKPDLVVIDEGAQVRVRAVLARAGIPVADVSWASSLDDIRRVTRQLASALGVPERGEAMLAEMDKNLAAARAMAPNPPVSALIYQPNGYAASGSVTEVLMQASGLRNVAPSLGPTRQGTIPVETLVANPPELLIVGSNAGESSSRARQVLNHPALRALPQTTHKVSLDLAPLLCPGPWSAQAAVNFAREAQKARALAGGTLTH
jgi:iron complex transport system substrate-binding protein